MQRTSRHIILLGLITVFLVCVLVRYPLTDYSPGNTDAYAYVGMSYSIIKTQRIPWLLHPVFSFLGLYPASDTSGIFVLHASAYSVCGLSNLFQSSVLLTLVILIIFICGIYLLTAFFVKQPIVRILPALFIAASPLVIGETNFFIVGSRILAVMFILLFLLTLLLLLFKDYSRQKKMKIIALSLVFLVGGGCTHLLTIFFFAFIISPVILTILITKVFPIAIRNTGRFLQKIPKYSWLVILGVFGIILLLDSFNLTVVKYKEFYASEQAVVMSGRFLGFLKDIPLIVVFITYLTNIGFFIALTVIGVLFITKANFSRKKIFLIVNICVILFVIFETGYFPYITMIFAALLAGVGVEAIIKKPHANLSIVLMLMTYALCMIWYLFYSYVSDYYKSTAALLPGIISLVVVFSILLYVARSHFKIKNNRENLKKIITVAVLSQIIIITSCYGMYRANFDLCGYVAANKVPHYPPQPLIQIAMYTRYSIDESDRVLFPTYGGNTQFSALSGNTMYGETLTENEDFVKNLNVTPVTEYDIHKPKDFFVATLKDTPDLKEFSGGSVILYLYLRGLRYTSEMREKYDIHYACEFLPYEKSYVSYFFKWATATSPLLIDANQQSYCIYSNVDYKMYYIS